MKKKDIIIESYFWDQAVDICLETEQLMKTYKCPKVVTTDGDIMLANLIKGTKELIQ